MIQKAELTDLHRVNQITSELVKCIGPQCYELFDKIRDMEKEELIKLKNFLTNDEVARP